MKHAVMACATAAVIALSLPSAPGALLAQGTPGGPAATAPMSATGVQFTQEVVNATKLEIDTSELALKKSTNAGINSFAGMMVADHRKAADALTKVIEASNKKLPGAMSSPKYDAVMKALDGASGKDFDAQYARAQVQAHEETVTLFDSYARGGDDPKLKEFAYQTLPTLRAHLEAAKKLQAM